MHVTQLSHRHPGVVVFTLGITFYKNSGLKCFGEVVAIINNTHFHLMPRNVNDPTSLEETNPEYSIASQLHLIYQLTNGCMSIHHSRGIFIQFALPTEFPQRQEERR